MESLHAMLAAAIEELFDPARFRPDYDFFGRCEMTGGRYLDKARITPPIDRASGAASCRT